MWQQESSIPRCNGSFVLLSPLHVLVPACAGALLLFSSSFLPLPPTVLYYHASLRRTRLGDPRRYQRRGHQQCRPSHRGGASHRDTEQQFGGRAVCLAVSQSLRSIIVVSFVAAYGWCCGWLEERNAASHRVRLSAKRDRGKKDSVVLRVLHPLFLFCRRKVEN